MLDIYSVIHLLTAILQTLQNLDRFLVRSILLLKRPALECAITFIIQDGMSTIRYQWRKELSVQKLP